ncbi:MAG: dephospho-CoA kinase [Lachnospiraceae bacterium]|nr:dephospho-CoA kinase [Lachnospiraceae bacterium]
MRIVGITGGVGSGKTELLERIETSHDCKVISADQVAHLVKEPGGSCYAGIVDLLGQSILDEDGVINRGRMAELIFADQGLLKEINNIIHPAVKEYIVGQIDILKENCQIELLFIEAALLIEDEYDKIVDELWYIFADEGVRRKRLKEKRGYSAGKIDKIIGSQLSDTEYRLKCQVIIDNSDEIDVALKQVEEILGAVEKE